MNVIELHSLAEPGAELFAGLTDAQLRARPEGVFIAEGLTVIGHALDAGVAPLALLVERKHIEGKAKTLIERCGGVPVYTGDSALLAQLTGFALTRGVLAAMRRPCPVPAAEVLRGARRAAVLCGVGDASNVGALMRSAAALGMDAVLVTPDTCDPLHRRAVRVSMGTVFQVPWAYLPAMPGAGTALLKEAGFTTAALALTEQSVSPEDAALAAEEKLAMVLGAEGSGLPQAVIDGSDYTVCIPMAHGVDLLNVAAAGAVAFWVLGKRKDRA